MALTRVERLAMLFAPENEESFNLDNLDDLLALPERHFLLAVSHFRSNNVIYHQALEPELEAVGREISTVHSNSERDHYMGLLPEDEILKSLTLLIKKKPETKFYLHTSCVQMPERERTNCLYAYVCKDGVGQQYHFPLHLIHLRRGSIGGFIDELEAFFGERVKGVKEEYKSTTS